MGGLAVAGDSTGAFVAGAVAGWIGCSAERPEPGRLGLVLLSSGSAYAGKHKLTKEEEKAFSAAENFFRDQNFLAAEVRAFS